MKTYDNALPISKLSAWLAAIIFAIFCPALSYSQSIAVYPGQSIQDMVNLKPNGTTFLLKAGVHRMQSVTPKDYDIFQGEPGTILSGARLLTMTPEGKYWIATGQMQEGQRSGACDSAHPRCTYPEDLFIDDRPLVHVSSLSAVVAGKWYFDYAANKVYMADNPAGHRVEIGVSRVAFSGKAVGVGIRGLVIEKYASPAQMGAIGDQYPSTDWTVQDSELRWNHGAGMRLGSRWKALRNKVHHNGQIGIRATSADDVLVEGNEIAFNNTLGFDGAWESGGTKFERTARLTVRNNNCHDNAGSGLLTDVDNINTVYESNQVVNNWSGIVHNVSYDAVIRYNTVTANATSANAWLWGAQIQVQNSQKVQVYNNQVTIAASGGNGIALIQQNRGSGKYGPYVTVNNSVHDNTIIHLADRGGSGAVADYNAAAMFGGGNKFDRNTYRVPSANSNRWTWNNVWVNWAGFRSNGQEANGSLGNTPAPNQPPVCVSQEVSTLEQTAVSMTLQASDPDGDALKYTVTASPANGTLTGTAPNLTYTAKAGYAGADSLTFQASDGKGGQATGTVKVNVRSNQPPVAAFSVNPTSGQAPVTATMDASASSDPDGSISSFTWNFGDNTTGTGPTTSHVYTTAGTYQITLTVKDNQQKSTSISKSISVVAPATVNHAPVCVSQQKSTIESTPVNVALQASDADGDTLVFAISAPPVSGQLSGSGANVTYTANAGFSGTDTFTFQATDSKGASGTGTVTVTVIKNQAPVAVFSASATSGQAPLSVSFDATGSSDPDGTVASYAWIFGDGGTASGKSVSHSFSASGTFTVSLTVQDDRQKSSAAATKVISVTAANTNQAPVVDAGLDQVAPVGVSVSLNGKVSDDGMPSGSTVTSKWTQVSGPASVAFSNTAAASSPTIGKVWNSANYHHANTRYVSTSGNDANDGKSLAGAWRSINKAVSSSPADTLIRIQPGSYSEMVNSFGGKTNISLIGDTTNPASRPSVSVQQYSVFDIRGASYVTLDNLKIQAVDNGSGNFGSPIFMGGTGQTHHVTVRNCELLGVNSSPNGIHVYGADGSAMDYLTFEDNVIHSAPGSTALGWNSNIGPSGISLFQIKQLDTASGVHIVIRRNFIYNVAQNHISDGIGQGNITDGNGIILDMLSTSGYSQRIEIYDNIVVYPGAQGINIYLSTNPVYVYNNTVYQPGRCFARTSCDGQGIGGGVAVNNSKNITVFNNTTYGRGNSRSVLKLGSSSTAFADYNHGYNVSGNDFAGAHDQGGDPAFANPTTSSTSWMDWVPKATSILSGTGTASFNGGSVPAMDYDGHAQTTPPALGAQMPDGTGSASPTDPTAPSTVVSFPVAGTYVMRLTATDGQLSADDDVVINITGPAPTAPTGLTASGATTSQVSLTWTDTTSSETGFNIQRCQGSGCSNFAQIAQAGANTTSYTDSGLSAGTTYVYRVAAYNGTGVSAFSNLATVQTASSSNPVISGITINPGDDIQSIVSNAPEGASFVLKAGLYRMQSVTPRNNQKFTGEAGAVMSGARLLTPVREGSYWVAYGQTQEGQVHGQCDSTHPRCMYPEDLFLDDQLLVHVSSASAVAPGKWFFDYASDKVYMGDDPTGHRVEIGVARRAFAGAATGVTIDGLIIEKYASPAQMGAIGDQYPAANWTVQNSEVRFNHGVGVMAAGGWKVINNKLHHNGQMGFRAEGGSGLVFESNEVAYNNSAGFNAGWEAGAFKVLSSDGAVIRANKSHHNNGPAGWTDIDNINTMVENNEFGPGNAMGYAHEISYAAVIRNNRIFGNGGPGCSWVWAAAIQVQNSSNVEVYGNQIDTRGGCENGIVVIQQNRGSGKFGVYTGQNNYVHDNVVIHGNSVGRNGVAAEYDQASALATNRFDHNTYHVTNLNDAHFVWSYYDWINWNTFKSKGQEITGTADTNLP